MGVCGTLHLEILGFGLWVDWVVKWLGSSVSVSLFAFKKHICTSSLIQHNSEIAASPLREDTIFLLSDSGQDPSFVLLFFGFNF